ncbi:hypothetical protein B0H13DRAFT_2401464 [Mycena leptocephala]|nr:hypothetical protein B0H13DRAFT_2401464 [Mycena leptocephala]
MPNTPPFILSLDLCTPSLRPSNGLPPFVPERPRLHRLPLAYAFLIRSISYILVYSASPRPSCAAMLTTVSRLHPHTLILIRCLPFLSFPLSSSLPIRVHASSQSLPQNPTIDAAVTGSAAGYVQLTTERERGAQSRLIPETVVWRGCFVFAGGVRLYRTRRGEDMGAEVGEMEVEEGALWHRRVIIKTLKLWGRMLADKKCVNNILEMVFAESAQAPFLRNLVLITLCPPHPFHSKCMARQDSLCERYAMLWISDTQIQPESHNFLNPFAINEDHSVCQQLSCA